MSVCPNRDATLDTHCGGRLRRVFEDRACLRCGQPFEPRTEQQRYRSQACGRRRPRSGRAVPALRRVDRPPFEQLVEGIARPSYSAAGRVYGVSDDAVRKWIRRYERERQAT